MKMAIFHLPWRGQGSFCFAPQSNALSAPIVQLVGVFDIEFLERNQISASQT